MRPKTLLLIIVLIIFSFSAIDTTRSSGKERLISEKALKALLPQMEGVRFVSKHELIRKGIMFEDDEDIETYGCGLTYIENDFDKDGEKDMAICGVYFNTQGRKEVPFLLIISIQSNGTYRKEFFREFHHFFFICKESNFTQFQKGEVLRIGFKAHSDLGGSILWKNKEYVFEYHIPP